MTQQNSNSGTDKVWFIKVVDSENHLCALIWVVIICPGRARLMQKGWQAGKNGILFLRQLKVSSK